MDPYTLAILFGAALATSAAGVYTNSQNIKYAQGANDTSIALANTAHQREVRDLQAAGLNPILSATGSGAAVPQLKVPGLENPLGDLQSSASGIASAVNGLKEAEIKTAQAEAESAKHEQHLLENESRNSDMQLSVDTHSLAADNVEEAARFEALTGIGSSEVESALDYGNNSDAVKAYDNLVKKYRNEIEQGRYTSSVERQVIQDTIDGATSSAGAVSRFIPRTIRHTKRRLK